MACHKVSGTYSMDGLESFIRSILGPAAEQFDYSAGGTTRRGWRVYLRSPDNYVDPEPACEFVDTHWRAFHERDIRLFVGSGVFEIAPGIYADSWGEQVFDPADGPPPPPDESTCPPSATPVVALPNLPTLDIIEFAKVGTHNAPPENGPDVFELMKSLPQIAESPEALAILKQREPMIRAAMERMPRGQQPWKAVQDALATVMQIAPFEIQFADEAGLHATFLNTVTRDQATLIARHILDVNYEAMDVFVRDAQAAGIPLAMEPEQPQIPDYIQVAADYIRIAGKFRMWWD